jgi:hypothetical protein
MTKLIEDKIMRNNKMKKLIKYMTSAMADESVKAEAVEAAKAVETMEDLTGQAVAGLLLILKEDVQKIKVKVSVREVVRIAMKIAAIQPTWTPDLQQKVGEVLSGVFDDSLAERLGSYANGGTNVQATLMGLYDRILKDLEGTIPDKLHDGLTEVKPYLIPALVAADEIITENPKVLAILLEKLQAPKVKPKSKQSGLFSRSTRTSTSVDIFGDDEDGEDEHTVTNKGRGKNPYEGSINGAGIVWDFYGRPD